MPENRKNNLPNRLADRYRVEAPIGEGAHASTWRGWDERLERPVAIKMLHQQLASDPVFVQRFQAEAKAAASVRQGNVVDVYDFGQQDGTLYIVMQFIDGEDLKSLINRAAPLPARDVRRIIGNVLDGLQAIHAAGIVHRDIKPQNILIGTDGVARVTDFGVAEVDVTAGLTGDGLTIGTVDYMAPEQAQGLPLTPAADLYATGVMLYEMLTGTLPFQGKNSRETMLQHINGQLVPPGTRMPERGITSTMDAVVGQSLAKDPARRFGSARAMKQAIGQSFTATAAPAPTQQTSVIPQAAQPVVPTAPYQAPVYVDEDAGAGLNGAFKGLIVLIIIGAIGVGLWGAYQLLNSESFDFNIPGIGNQQENTEPTATAIVVNEGIEPIEPTDPQEEAPPAVAEPTNPPAPTEIPPEQPAPTDVPMEQPTDVPADAGNEVPIEPIEPDGGVQPTDPPNEDPVIDPSGYDDGYSIA